MDQENEDEQSPVAGKLMLAGVLSVVGLGAAAMLVLAAAALVFR